MAAGRGADLSVGFPSGVGLATLSSLYPSTTVILARVVLQERLRPAQVGGVVCAAAAIVLIVSA